MRVFDKVHCLLCKLEYSSVRACFRQGPLCLVQARVLISPCVFSTSSIVPPGLCSVQSAWFSGKFCSVNLCCKAGGTTPRHSGLILVLRAVGNRCKMTFLHAAPMMVCAVPSVCRKCLNRNLYCLQNSTHFGHKLTHFGHKSTHFGHKVSLNYHGYKIRILK